MRQSALYGSLFRFRQPHRDPAKFSAGRSRTMKPTPNFLIPIAAFLALFFGWMGYTLWNAKMERTQRIVEARGLENFNETQMRVWKNCESIEQSLGAVYRKLEGFDSVSNAAKDQARRLLLPHECQFLNDLRSRTRADRVRRQE